MSSFNSVFYSCTNCLPNSVLYSCEHKQGFILYCISTHWTIILMRDCKENLLERIIRTLVVRLPGPLVGAVTVGSERIFLKAIAYTVCLEKLLRILWTLKKRLKKGRKKGISTYPPQILVVWTVVAVVFRSCQNFILTQIILSWQVNSLTDIYTDYNTQKANVNAAFGISFGKRKKERERSWEKLRGLTICGVWFFFFFFGTAPDTSNVF